MGENPKYTGRKLQHTREKRSAILRVCESASHASLRVVRVMRVVRVVRVMRVVRVIRVLRVVLEIIKLIKNAIHLTLSLITFVLLVFGRIPVGGNAESFICRRRGHPF
jgi:hypothetical protein